MPNKGDLEKGIKYINQWYDKCAEKESLIIASTGESWSPKKIKAEIERRQKTNEWPDDIITTIVLSASKGEIQE